MAAYDHQENMIFMFKLLPSRCGLILPFSSERLQGLNRAVFHTCNLGFGCKHKIHSHSQITVLMDASFNGDSGNLGFCVSYMERPCSQLAPQRALPT